MSYVNEVNKRKYADPEYIAISELLSSIGEVDEYEASHHEDYRAGGGIYQNASGGFRKRSKNGGISRSGMNNLLKSLCLNDLKHFSRYRRHVNKERWKQ
jgi:hypothetical protein